MSDPADVHGELLAELEEGWAPLPTRTLLALVVGGLRVRMMRSLVTMVSIVLAIAFLTYTGFSGGLYLNLAERVRADERLETVEVKRIVAAASVVSEADIFGELGAQERREAAIELGMGDVRKQIQELGQLKGPLSKARGDLAEAEKKLAELEADSEAIGADLEAARTKIADAGPELESVERLERELSEEIELGRWLAQGFEEGEPETGGRLRPDTLERALDRALVGRQEYLFGRAARFAQLSEEDLDRVEVMLELAARRSGAAAPAPAGKLRHLPAAAGAQDGGTELVEGAAEAVGVLRKALGRARTERAATVLRIDLRRAGINIESTLEGSTLDTWLVVMALLTCTVGIANAVLMSVTERFREIGTMKCLGAQDGLVVKMFLLESCMLGAIGAGVGIILGVLVALGAGLAQFGGFAFYCFPLAKGLRVIGWSILAGMFLAVVGAVYPALVAARMQPVDALRADE